MIAGFRSGTCLALGDGQPSHAVAAHNQGVGFGGSKRFHVVQNTREPLLGRKCGTGIFFQYLPGADTVIDRDFKQFCFRGAGGQKDEHPLLVQPSAGDGVFHILDILVEITRQVGRPRQVHEECPFVVGRRNFFFLATRQAGESDEKQYGKQAD